MHLCHDTSHIDKLNRSTNGGAFGNPSIKASYLQAFFFHASQLGTLRLAEECISKLLPK